MCRLPPNVADVVAELDPEWKPPAPVELDQAEPQKPRPVPLADLDILDGIRAGVFGVDLKTGEVTARGRVLAFFSNRTDRRRFVRLHMNGRRRGIAVARLVWMAATLSLIPEGWEVHHNDEDSGNDAWENLLCLHALDHRKKHGRAEADTDVPF